jgi:acyl-coenzyme A synthetase/AMP-(fatty) acid ligase
MQEGFQPEGPFGGLSTGDELERASYDVSIAANDRYWAGAGIEHAERAAHALFPPMAANLTVLAVQAAGAGPLLHTAQRLVAHDRATAPATLVAAGRVTKRFEKRDRQYLEATLDVTTSDGLPLWTSVATFCEPGASAR